MGGALSNPKLTGRSDSGRIPERAGAFDHSVCNHLGKGKEKIMEAAGQGSTERGASFFDVDRTLIRGDTQEMEGRCLMKRDGLASGRLPAWILTLAAIAAHRMGLGSLIRQNEAYIRMYKGRTREALAALGLEIYGRQIRNRVLDGARDLLEARRKRGDLIVLVTATTPHLIRPLEMVFKPDQVFCTELEFDRQGRATGRAAGGVLLGEKKAEKIHAFARERHLSLSLCRAYSDHHSDLPMLEAVGYPEVINPTPELAALARERGWPIHRFKG